MAFSWTYHDYMAQANDAARLARARLHHAEISAQISATASQGSSTFDTANLETALARVTEDIVRLESRVGPDGGGRRASIGRTVSRLR